MSVSIAQGVTAVAPKQIVAGTNITTSETDTTITINSSGGSGGSSIWGSITGTLSAQTDLQTALNTKVSTSDIGSTVQPYNSGTVIDSSYVHTDNNYTTTEQTKLSGIASGAEVNVNADWNATSGDAYILNKPTIPAQFNPIAGTNITLSGTYPNITFTATGSGGGGTTVYTGDTSIDFGSGSGTNMVSVSVTGQSAITSTSAVKAWIAPTASASHNVYEHIIVPLRIVCSDIIAGSGFTITAVSDLRLTGTFNIKWEWV